MRFYLGIDVSKAKLDGVLLDSHTSKRKSKVVDNTAVGIATLLAWANKQGANTDELHVVMEPTGIYHETAAFALHAAGVRVSLVNPLYLRRFAESLGTQRKNDAIDAAVLARFGQERQPEPWQPPSPAMRQLHALLARRDAVAADLQRELNRQEQALLSNAPVSVLDSIRQSIEHLGTQLQQLQQAISSHIDNDPGLRSKRQLLLSIPGVGERVADRFTSLLGDQRFERAEQLAAYLGLIPIEFDSGTSVHKPPRLSKAGPSHLRALLYMPAVVAKQHNPHVKALYDRLLTRGKSKMAAIGAAMRKLVHLCFGVVRSGQPYSPNWATGS